MADPTEPAPVIVVTEIGPDTEKKLSEVAKAVSERQKPRPGYGAFGILCAFLAVGMLGIIFLFQDNARARIAGCERSNVVRAKMAEIIASAEASTPGERYTAEAKAFYDKAFVDLALVDCTGPAKSIPTPSFPQRPVRQVGEAASRPPPSPPPLAGAQGEPGERGATGAPGEPGAPGLPGRDGAAGTDGTVVVIVTPTTTVPAATTTTGTVPPTTTTATTTSTTVAPTTSTTRPPSLLCVLLRCS